VESFSHVAPLLVSQTCAVNRGGAGQHLHVSTARCSGAFLPQVVTSKRFGGHEKQWASTIGLVGLCVKTRVPGLLKLVSWQCRTSVPTPPGVPLQSPPLHELGG
jgi:hypothetical protein